MSPKISLTAAFRSVAGLGRLRSKVSFLLALGLASSLSAEIPRPEHSRPDALRENWLNLNGEWQFEIDDRDDGVARGLESGHDLSSKIVVPFCPESKLSGLGHYDFMKHLWYRRSFTLPDSMKNQRVLLHFGGVYYRAWVFVNGQAAGSHNGGSAGFDFDITKLLRDGANELVVHVFDDVASGKQPSGKQTHTVSEGCVYTRTSGIWQTVWLEGVGSSFVENVSVVPDPENSRVLIDAAINGLDTNLVLTVEAFADGKPAGRASSPASWRGNHLVVNLSEKHLWEPESPFLYDLKFTLARGDKTLDEMKSYFGLRDIAIEGRAILINGKRVFQRLILDQGFYPDGVWTAPSDAELKADIERSLAAGFNGARLHQKVFEPRYLYWADKLGYLVWGEFPNWGFDYHPADYSNFINEWTEELLRDRGHPAIIGWCPFNETGPNAGELQQIIWRQTRAIDPSRPIIESSGWAHTLTLPEVLDAHDYNQDPAAFRQNWMDFFASHSAAPTPARYGAAGPHPDEDKGLPFMISEFGGIGWATEGGWGYGNGPRSLDEFYTRYQGLVDAQLDNPNLFGFCYTQLTDVEQEHNGLYYYNRRPKFDLNRLHAITSRRAAYEINGPSAARVENVAPAEFEVLVGAAADGDLCRPYHFTTNAPAVDWTAEKFADDQWETARAPFGNALPGVRTPWKTDDIWLRQAFESGGDNFKSAKLVIFHDEDTEVYVNGRLVWKGTGFTSTYEAHSVTAALNGAIKKGANVLAIHTHQTVGGQFIDLALLGEPRRAETAAQ
jgi:hypothetical protein